MNFIIIFLPIFSINFRRMTRLSVTQTKIRQSTDAVYAKLEENSIRIRVALRDGISKCSNLIIDYPKKGLFFYFPLMNYRIAEKADKSAFIF